MQKKDIILIRNTLSNIYDWESENLKKDFINFIGQQTQLCPLKLGQLFDEYNHLSPLIKDSVTFNLEDFIKKLLI